METRLLDAGTLALDLERTLRAVPGIVSGHALRVMGQAETESVIHASAASSVATKAPVGPIPHDPGLIVAALVVGVVIGVVIGRKTAGTSTKT
jgi:hypothetical protein